MMTTEEESSRMHCVDKVRTLLGECLGPPNETAFLNFDRYVSSFCLTQSVVLDILCAINNIFLICSLCDSRTLRKMLMEAFALLKK